MSNSTSNSQHILLLNCVTVMQEGNASSKISNKRLRERKKGFYEKSWPYMKQRVTFCSIATFWLMLAASPALFSKDSFNCQ